MMEEKEIFSSTEGIICPMCKREHLEWWELVDIEQDDQNFYMNCLHCDWYFQVMIEVNRVFKTFDL